MELHFVKGKGSGFDMDVCFWTEKQSYEYRKW